VQQQQPRERLGKRRARRCRRNGRRRRAQQARRGRGQQQRVAGRKREAARRKGRAAIVRGRLGAQLEVDARSLLFAGLLLFREVLFSKRGDIRFLWVVGVVFVEGREGG
jgi:hypothetical protein